MLASILPTALSEPVTGDGTASHWRERVDITTLMLCGCPSIRSKSRFHPPRAKAWAGR